MMRNSGVHSIGGLGGSGAGTKALTFSPIVDTVTYLPWSFRFIVTVAILK
jgi:hypothetical protein